jgi:hypothetical protein
MEETIFVTYIYGLKYPKAYTLLQWNTRNLWRGAKKI